MKIAIVYDCIFPWTIGGAERWYRNLAERLAAAGHDVTYLTLRQWDATDPPQIPGVEVIAVGPRLALYSEGKRRISPPVRFGWGVFLHLLRHGARYDRVHLASFPFFSLLAVGLLLPVARYRIAVDWHEVWTSEYWRAYLGPLGKIGVLVQRLCARIPQKPYAFSRLHAARARDLGCREPVTILTGEFAGSASAGFDAADPPVFVYAGRLIPEKRVSLLIDAFALLRKRKPDARLTIFGRGPEEEAIGAQIALLGLDHAARLAGFVAEADIQEAMARAVAIVQPSEREGYGMVVVEAASRGVPVVVVDAPDNATVELVDAGRNGFIADNANPTALADAMNAVLTAGAPLRARTRDWFADNQTRLSIDHSLSVILTDMEAEKDRI